MGLSKAYEYHPFDSLKAKPAAYGLSFETRERFLAFLPIENGVLNIGNKQKRKVLIEN